MELKAGHFYKSKAGDVWCCVKVRPVGEVADEHSRADCVCVRGLHPQSEVEYYYIDGRYDRMGVREHCLIEECGPNGEHLVTREPSACVLSLNALRDRAYQIAQDHGFTDASVPEDVALFHSEATELLEDFRDGRLMHEVHYVEKVQVCDRSGQPITDDHGAPVKVEVLRKAARGPDGALRKPCGPPSELADIIVRVLHFCGKHGVDIEGAVAEKMAYNDSRPFKHGGKKI